MDDLTLERFGPLPNRRPADTPATCARRRAVLNTALHDTRDEPEQPSPEPIGTPHHPTPTAPAKLVAVPTPHPHQSAA